MGAVQRADVHTAGPGAAPPDVQRVLPELARTDTGRGGLNLYGPWPGNRTLSRIFVCADFGVGGVRPSRAI